MPLQIASFSHRSDERIDDWLMRVGRRVIELVQDVCGQLEYGHVVDVVADIPPGISEACDALGAPRFKGRWHVLVDLGESILKGEGVEEYKARDSQCSRTVFFLIGLGNDVSDAIGGSRVIGYLSCPLLERQSNEIGRGLHGVHPFDIQRQGAEVGREVFHGSGSDASVRV